MSEYLDLLSRQGIACSMIFGFVPEPPWGPEHRCPGCQPRPETVESKFWDRWHEIDNSLKKLGESSSCPIMRGEIPTKSFTKEEREIRLKNANAIFAKIMQSKIGIENNNSSQNEEDFEEIVQETTKLISNQQVHTEDNEQISNQQVQVEQKQTKQSQKETKKTKSAPKKPEGQGSLW